MNGMKQILQKLVICICVTLSVTQAYGQGKELKKADEDFDKYAYIDAREIYLKVVEDGYSSAQIYKRLGDTYYYNSEYKEAAKWYERLLTEYPDEVEAAYYYRGAQSFKSIKKYEASDTLMKQYAAMGGDGLIVKNYQDNPDYLTSIAFAAKGYDVKKVDINTEYSDFGPSYFMDKVVFASASNTSEGTKTHDWNAQPYLDLYIADVAEDGSLSNAELIAGDVNTKYHESSTAFTKDGRTLYFTRNNYFNGKKGRDKNKTVRLKLYKATKSGENFWGNIEELPFSGKTFSVAHPTLSKDEKRLYFASDMEGTIGMSDLWYVDIYEDGTYGEPINLGPSVNTEARESFPFISEQNNLYFSSDGRAGLGGLDIYVAPINENGSIGEISNLGEPANSPSDDFGFIIKEEKRIGYLSSNRGGDQGSIDDDIYLVQEKCEISITGVVTDVDTGVLLPGAIVTLLDSNNNQVSQVTVGADARYLFEAMAECETQYSIRGTKPQYAPNEIVVQTPNKTGTIEVPVPLKLVDPCPPKDLGCKLKLQPIYFDFDRFNIRPDAAVELAKILAAMRQYPELIIHIESHTDSRGVDAYNEALSEKRAQSTLNWLVEQGIDKSRLSAKGYGEYRLVNQCSNGVKCTEEEHQLNRRSMFIIQN